MRAIHFLGLVVTLAVAIGLIGLLDSPPPGIVAISAAALQPVHPLPVYLPLVAAEIDIQSGDIVREPSIPIDWSADADFVLGGPAMTIDIEGDVAFVGIGAHLVAMDVSGDGESVTLGASPPLPGIVADVVVRDDLAFVAVSQRTVVAEDPGGLYVLDVADPSAPRVIGISPIVGGAIRLVVEVDQVLLLSWDQRIRGVGRARIYWSHARRRL